MFGFELWFVTAVASAFFVGTYMFTLKIASARNYNSLLFNTLGLSVSATLLFSTSLYLEGTPSISFLMVLLAAAGGILFLIGSNFRFDALKYIDATIALPLHKVVSPAAAIIFGLLLFGERFSYFEWVGLVISVLIPILLISNNEKHRQTNLVKGVVFVTSSALLAAVVAMFNKLGPDLFTNFFLYAAVANAIGAGIGWLRYWYQRRVKSETGAPIFQTRLLRLLGISAFLQYAGFATMMISFAEGGTLGIVYTINSLYILIPIILSIIFYNEHWNLRKVIAIVLSVAAVGLLG